MPIKQLPEGLRFAAGDSTKQFLGRPRIVESLLHLSSQPLIASLRSCLIRLVARWPALEEHFNTVMRLRAIAIFGHQKTYAEEAATDARRGDSWVKAKILSLLTIFLVTLLFTLQVTPQWSEADR